MSLTMPTWGTVCRHKISTSQANSCTTIEDDSIFSHSREM